MSEEATLDEFAQDGEERTDQQDSEQRLPEIDDNPSDWRLVTVEDISDDLIGGGTPSKSNEEYWGGKIPWASVKDLNGIELAETEDYITKSGVENSATNLIPKDSVVISTRMTVGEPFLNRTEMAINQDMKAIIPDTEQVNPLFFVYSLWDKDPYLKSLGRGTTVDGITTNDLALTHLGLPPRSEQRKIATVLYTVDRAIEKTEKIIKQSEKVRQGVTQDIFTTGYYNHSEYSDVRLGPVKTSVPENWNVHTIPDCFEIIDGDRGKNYPSGSDFSDEGYCLFLSATNVTENGLKFDEAEFITQQKDEELRKGKLKRGDIIMTTRGTVGNFGLFDHGVDYDNVRINSGMVILRPKDNTSPVEYYYHLFRSGIFQRQINATSYGTAQPQTSVTDIKKMGILEPDEDEKRQISQLIKDMVSEIQTQKEYRNQLRLIKRGLLQDLLSGTVRTTDTNIEVPDEIAQYG